MKELDKLAQQNLGMIVLALGVLSLVLLALLVVTMAKQRKAEQKWKILLGGVRGENLEKMLYDHVTERSRIDSELKGHVNRLESLESRIQTAKRYMGIVRYDAFPDVGGEQSFALAIYDEQGHGAVLSSVVGRSTARVFCKEIIEGEAKRDLTDEEKKAIELAALNRAKSLQLTK
jgi:hypothetical protein